MYNFLSFQILTVLQSCVVENIYIILGTCELEIFVRIESRIKSALRFEFESNLYNTDDYTLIRIVKDLRPEDKDLRPEDQEDKDLSVYANWTTAGN